MGQADHLGFGPSGEERRRRPARWDGHGRTGPTDRMWGWGGKKLISFSNFPKQFPNTNSKQFGIQLQTKQFKIICSGMNAHT
jgi:hypothetical protein